MRLLVRLLSGMPPLTENEGICQAGPTGSDVDWSSTCEVERWQIVQPAIAVPGPARDRTVDDRRPEEAEDEGGNDAATLERASDHNLHSAGAEE